MRLKLIVVFSLIFCCFTPSYAQTDIDDQGEETQFWTETQIIFPTRDRVDLMLFGVLRMGRDLARPVDERGGVGVAFKTNKFLTVIPTWLYIAQQPTAMSKNVGHRLVFNATFKFPLGKFAFTDRNLVERRPRLSKPAALDRQLS